MKSVDNSSIGSSVDDEQDLNDSVKVSMNLNEFLQHIAAAGDEEPVDIAVSEPPIILVENPD